MCLEVFCGEESSRALEHHLAAELSPGDALDGGRVGETHLQSVHSCKKPEGQGARRCVRGGVEWEGGELYTFAIDSERLAVGGFVALVVPLAVHRVVLG